jgi:uncharacterized protein (TIGR00106 family)
MIQAESTTQSIRYPKTDASFLIRLLSMGVPSGTSVVQFCYARYILFGGCPMAVAEITVVPLGTETPSLSHFVAELEKIVSESGLPSELHAMGTNVEGSLEEIMALTKRLHFRLFQLGALRVSTTLKIDERTDKQLTLKGKVEAVRRKTG